LFNLLLERMEVLKNTKDIIISARMSGPEYKLVESMGVLEGLGTSELIRVVIREAAEKRGLYPVNMAAIAQEAQREHHSWYKTAHPEGGNQPGGIFHGKTLRPSRIDCSTWPTTGQAGSPPDGLYRYSFLAQAKGGAMTPEERAARIEELRLRYFYLVAEMAQVEQELKGLGQEPSNLTQPIKSKGKEHGRKKHTP
jgi:hypothetical protein